MGQLREPLLSPNLDEQDGYVPNVVYSCGSLIHAGMLVVPYGIGDWSIGIATVESEKAEIELPSPVSGVFAKALVGDGETVPVGTDLAVIAADADEYASLGGS